MVQSLDSVCHPPVKGSSTRCRTTLSHHLSNFAAGLSARQDFLTCCSADPSVVDGSTKHENLLFDTLAQATNNVKLPVKPPDTIKSLDDLSCKDFCVREFDGLRRRSKRSKKKPKKPIYVTLRVGDDCAGDALLVSDLAQVLPSHLQLKKLYLQGHRTVPNGVIHAMNHLEINGVLVVVL